MKRKDYNKKIEKIIASRNELLENTKEELESQIKETISSIDDTLFYLYTEEEKDYKTIIKSKEKIISLTNEIKNSESLEEIAKLRKRLNYQLNKVKKEFEKKEMLIDSIEDYSKNVLSSKKSISKFVRYLKRESNIDKIIYLNDNIDNLSKEDKKNLDRLIKNERDYNSRNLRKNKEKKDITIEPKKIEETPVKKCSNKKEVLTSLKTLSLMLASSIAVTSAAAKLEKKPEVKLEEPIKIERFIENDIYEEAIVITAKAVYSALPAISEKTEEPVITEEEKIEYLKNYFAVDEDSAYMLFDYFIENMKKYGESLTREDLLDLFYEVANIPKEEKIEFAKRVCKTDDIGLKKIFAVYNSETSGYIDVMAACTTGVNHTDYELWRISTEGYFGEGTGDSLYYATCNYYQFEVFENPKTRYFEMLENSGQVGENAVLDTIILNKAKHKYMHDYTEFRDKDYPKGFQFVPGGDKHLREFPAEDRIIEVDYTLTLN